MYLGPWCVVVVVVVGLGVVGGAHMNENVDISHRSTDPRRSRMETGSRFLVQGG